MPLWTYAAAGSLGLWLVVLLLPWQPWRVREVLNGTPRSAAADLRDVTVLIPARNESALIALTLDALAAQGTGLRIIVIDDESDDDTAAQALRFAEVEVVRGSALPSGWTGKLWALEQGYRRVTSEFTLLLDADIRLLPGTVVRLREQSRQGFGLVSLMAELPMITFWERLLLPAFIYFFKLLYPFRLSNARFPHVAAAAGGCVLLRSEALRVIGGFGSIRAALIDDCTLAARIKAAGYRTWIGLTHSAQSLRPYGGPGSIWDMVARSAFTQLGYSAALLLLCSVLMLLAFPMPVSALFSGEPVSAWLGIGALLTMMITYLPTLRFYGLGPAWALTLPLAGLLYLAMTWTSAVRYWRGERSRWKDRHYAAG